MDNEKQFQLTYRKGPYDPETWGVGGVENLAPDEDVPALLALALGASYVDADGDTWERIE